MRLIPIPKEKYEEYRRDLMFDCYKWDPQFLDHNTIAPYALVITKEEQEELAGLTEALDKETRAAEVFLNEHPELAKPLALPRSVRKEIKHMTNYDAGQHVRLMRYDFHPTMEGGWAISEVNSDVPGGFAESSFMPLAARKLLEGEYSFRSFGQAMVEALAKKLPEGARIMMIHCTVYSDDRQVMEFLGDCLKEKGFQVIYGSADHLRFTRNKAYSILDGNEGRVDAIFRFTPLEWLTEIRPRHWKGYFSTIALSCNHPIAMYAQTKRFPLVWNVLEEGGVDLTNWRALLPDTLEVKAAKGKEGYIFKPACGRVGEKISIKEACSKEEYKQILKDVKRHPKKYLAQKKFHSKPLIGEDGREYHVCLGSYSIDGRHGGFYARISDTPRIDSNAADLPVLVEGNAFTQESNAFALPTHNEEEKEIYKVWAPWGCDWVDWVRPVPFVEMERYTKDYRIAPTALPVVSFLQENIGDSAILVDLPGAEGVTMGMALAKKGFRPIPIYNGPLEQEGAKAMVDNQSAAIALKKATPLLATLELTKDAPPAFLTDRNRLQQFQLMESAYDNSWDVFPQDLPSPQYFKDKGIRKIIILGKTVAPDLKKVLYAHQKKGLEIYRTNGYEAPKRVRLHKPRRTD